MTSVVPEAGDIVLLDLDPAKGTEQTGAQPCLVLSERLMQSFSKHVLVDQIRAVDHGHRILRIMDKVAEATRTEARDILATLCGIHPAEDRF